MSPAFPPIPPIVGYASGELDNDYGNVIIGAQFKDVADANGKISLSSIVPEPKGNLSASDLAYNVNFQLLNNWGGTVEGSVRIWDGSKWTTEADQDASAEKYDAAVGFCVANQADPDEGAVFLRSSGEVSKEDVVVALDDDFGNILAANPYPVAIKLSSLLPQSTYTDLGYNVNFQKLNNWGGTVDGSVRIWDGTKWTTEDNQDASNDLILPGEGICIANQVDPDDGAVTLRFTAPTIE